MLSRLDLPEDEAGARFAWSALFTVAAETDAKVLLFRAEVPGDPESRQWFVKVASLDQFVTVPPDAVCVDPASSAYGLCRKDSVQFVCRVADSLDTLEESLQEGLNFLAADLAALERLETPCL